MSQLHEALKALGPTDEKNLPNDRELKPYLEEAFRTASVIVDSLPNPPATPESSTATRSRANTTSSVTSSSARSGPPAAEIEPLQKEWKEVKPGGDNPHNVKVYKMSGKDGQGSWFARRSIHEGIGFKQFRRSLRREFEEGLKLRQERGHHEDTRDIMLKPGVRGIACERRMEHKVITGLGRLDVYQLSAQFPGPTSPREFVALCLTTAEVHPPQSSTSRLTEGHRKPREFTMISRPFTHPDLPEGQGYVRGHYESVEFIREIIPEAGTGPDSSNEHLGGNLHPTKTQMRSTMRDHESSHRSPAGDDSSATQGVPSTTANSNAEGDQVDEQAQNLPDESKLDGREQYPVEWIMITRSDPGGSVPRYLVDRGTPGSIITDAGKFLDWAVDKKHDDDLSDDDPGEEEAVQQDDKNDDNQRMRGYDSSSSSESDASSLSSFKTASSGDLSADNETSSNKMQFSERMTKQLQLDAERSTRDMDKEAIRQRKLTEKHMREAQKRADKFQRDQMKAEAKRNKEERKIMEKRQKLEMKDEKLRWQREREALTGENNLLKKERDALYEELDAARKEIEQLKAGTGPGGIYANPTPKASRNSIAADSIRSEDSASSSSMQGLKKVLHKVIPHSSDHDDVGKSLPPVASASDSQLPVNNKVGTI